MKSDINIILKTVGEHTEFVEIEDSEGRSMNVGTVSEVNADGFYKITIGLTDLPLRVWGRGAEVPAGMIVMDARGYQHPAPDDLEEPWGNYLGFVVEIPNLDQWQTIVDNAKSRGAVITDGDPRG